MNYKNVLVIGVGRTGSIAVKEMLPYDLDAICLYNRNTDKAKSLVAALSDSRIKLVEDISQAPKDIDLVVDFSSAYPQDQKANDLKRVLSGELDYDAIRQRDLAFNMKSKHDIYTRIKAQKITADVFMYTNPVDIMTAYVAFLLGRNNIYGVGLELDLGRAKQALREEYGLKDDDLEKVRVVGLHNKPIVLASEIKLGIDYGRIQQGVERILKESKSTPEISRDVQTKAIKELMEFLFGERKRYHLSIPYSDSFFQTRDSAIGVPVYRAMNGAIEKQPITLSGEETELFEQQRESVRLAMKQIRHDEFNQARVESENSPVLTRAVEEARRWIRWRAPEIKTAVQNTLTVSYMSLAMASIVLPLFREPTELEQLLSYVGR